MQELEIKDVQSAATYRVGPQGAVIGREGAKADIVVRNPSVSKRHAKIYSEGGAWYLEDLGSSNGTFFANQRISQPVEIEPGSLFALAEIQFEVTKLHGAEEAPAASSRARHMSIDPDMAPPRSSALGASAMSHDDDDEPRRSSDGLGPAPELDPPPADAKAGVGAALAALPKAIAYYLVTVPKLALNPIGTVRQSIEDQKFHAMGPWEMIGWALPPMILSAAVGFVFGLIFQLVSGTLSIGSILPIGPAIGAVVGSVIMGFIFHPVTAWVIKILKGQSDARSRSNYYVITLAVFPLSAIASGITLLIALIPLPFISVLPMVLVLGASLIGLLVAYRWLQHFNVVKWFLYVPLVLGVLSIASTGWNAVSLVLNGGGGGGMPAMAGAAGEMTDEQKAALEAAQKMAEAAAKAAGSGELAAVNGEEAAEAAARAAEAMAKAAQAAGGDAEKIKAQLEEAQKAAAAAAEAGKDAMKAAERDAEKASAQAAAAAAAAQREAQAAVEAAKTVREDAPPPKTAAITGSGYPAFAQKRDAVEKAISEDPTVLRRSGVQAAYERYLKAKYEVSKSFGGKRNKSEPWKDRLNDRLREIEQYEKTGRLVDDLYAKVFRR